MKGRVRITSHSDRSYVSFESTPQLTLVKPKRKIPLRPIRAKEILHRFNTGSSRNEPLSLGDRYELVFKKTCYIELALQISEMRISSPFQALTGQAVAFRMMCIFSPMASCSEQWYQGFGPSRKAHHVTSTFCWFSFILEFYKIDRIPIMFRTMEKNSNAIGSPREEETLL